MQMYLKEKKVIENHTYQKAHTHKWEKQFDGICIILIPIGPILSVWAGKFK